MIEEKNSSKESNKNSSSNREKKWEMFGFFAFCFTFVAPLLAMGVFNVLLIIMPGVGINVWLFLFGLFCAIYVFLVERYLWVMK